jgi:glutamate--cysteine ligase
VGAEFERHLLDGRGNPLPYYGEPGVRWLMLRLAEQDGWEPTMEGDHPIALAKGMARVTLEPGGQLELSGAPFSDVDGVDRELHAFNGRIDALLAGTGYSQVALGFTPFAEIDAVPWVPKGRYTVMRDYLKQTGELAHHMMKGTCATQASFDFADEADCARKVRLSTAIGPLTTAIFANSPLASGGPRASRAGAGTSGRARIPGAPGSPRPPTSSPSSGGSTTCSRCR